MNGINDNIAEVTNEEISRKSILSVLQKIFNNKKPKQEAIEIAENTEETLNNLQKISDHKSEEIEINIKENKKQDIKILPYNKTIAKGLPRKTRLLDERLGVTDILKDKTPKLTANNFDNSIKSKKNNKIPQISLSNNKNYTPERTSNNKKGSLTISRNKAKILNNNISSTIIGNVTQNIKITEHDINNIKNITGNNEYMTILTEIEDIFCDDLSKFDESRKYSYKL